MAIVQPKVLLVTGGLEGGGAERILSEMANYWAQKGWQVMLATWSGPETPDFYSLVPSVARVWLDVNSSNDSALAKICSNVNRVLKLRRLLRTSRPIAVLSFIDVSNVLTILAAVGLGMRVVVSERTNPGLNLRIARFWRALRRACYWAADNVIAQTEDAAQWLEKKCRVTAVVIPNSLRVLPRVVCEREPLIVAAGRLSKEKGFDLLLLAFARISPAFPDWRLVILGEGAERDALLDLIKRLDLEDRAALAGQVEDIEIWMARASILVHPSRREGFPNVVLEAMGMSTAVICARCPGISELVQDGVNGRLVPVGDLEALMEAMCELMRNPAQRARLGREAAKVRSTYDQSLIMQRWEHCLLPAQKRAI